MVSNYANILAKPVLSKKSIKNCRVTKERSKGDAHGTRNAHPAIFKTNDTAPYQLSNESYLQLMNKKAAPRRVKQRSSTSNSQSKPKHNKSTTAYVLNMKSSSRTNSTYKG